MLVSIQLSQSIMSEMLNLLSKFTASISGMSNRDLENIAKKTLKNFKGVYPSDSYPNLTKRDLKHSSIIFNLSPHYEEGSHFVAIFIKNNKVFFFDSFGSSLQNESIQQFLAKYFSSLFYNDKKIQSEKSIFCSLFALSFLLHMEEKNNFLNFVNMFSNSLSKNDKIVTRYIHELIRNKKHDCYI